MKTCLTLLLTLIATSVVGQVDTFDGSFELGGFKIRFLDCVEANDRGLLFTGRFEHGDYKTHSSLYGYDRKKYPQFVQHGYYSDPTTIVHKVSATGDSMWTKLYPYSLQGNDVIATRDGGYVLCGFRATDRESLYDGDHTQAVTLLKIDSTGKTLWFKQIPSDFNSTSDDIVELENGELLVLANRSYPRFSEWQLSPKSFILIKLTPSGDVIWNKEITTANDTTTSYSHLEIYWNKEITTAKDTTTSYIPSELYLAPRGNLYAIGTYSDQETGSSFYIAKINLHGKIEQSWRGKGINWGHSIAELSDGLVVCGSYRDNGYGQILVKLDRRLNTLWEYKAPYDMYRESKVLTTSTDDIYFLGNTKSDSLRLTVLSSKGRVINHFYKPNGSLTDLRNCILTQNGDVVGVGSKRLVPGQERKGVFFRFTRLPK